jgi:hypothetical protein
VTGELPWRDNSIGVSCIPIGKYKCVWNFSPRLGWGYLITGVPERSGVRIHVANFCGLASEGFKQELHGCVALGLTLSKLGKQKMLISSRIAISRFFTYLNKQTFTLEISDNGTR